MVSIVMPSYNTAKYIGNSIQSVLAQTYTDWELIIVDDCSTDNTDEIVNKYLDDKRIRYLKNEVNSGAALSRNYALREAKGRWIAFLDSDDLWHPKKLERQIAFMEENGYSFSYTDHMTQLNGEWLPYIYIGPKCINRRRMYNYCYCSALTVMYDQKKIGLIQIEDLRKNNDYAMWLQVIEKSNCYRLPECLAYYIRRQGSISNVSKMRLIKWHYILFNKGMNRSPLAAVILTGRNLFFGLFKKLFYKKKTTMVPQI